MHFLAHYGTFEVLRLQHMEMLAKILLTGVFVTISSLPNVMPKMEIGKQTF
jgi:hypothetical protein